MKTIAIGLFIVMYALMIALPAKFRPFISCGAALIFLLVGILPFQMIGGAIDWNILLMIFGTVVIVDYFIQSKMPNRIADSLLRISPNVMAVTIIMSLFSGLVSAFIDNVATVYMVAPVALAICSKLKISPVPMVISIAVSSNLQGAATLVGDTTSIMLAAPNAANMDFNDFFWFHGRPGIFFAVELGALLTVPIMLVLFRSMKDPVNSTENTEVEDMIPTIAMAGHILFLIAASFIPNKPEITNGVICMVWGIGCIVAEYIRTKDQKTMIENLKNVDYATIFLLAGLFVVIAGITNQGIIDDVAQLIVQTGGDNYFLVYSMIVWGSVLISAFVDNIPYVATMIPVVVAVAAGLGHEPYLLLFGLLIGATLGGNITPVGASANIAGTGLLRKEGYDVSFKEFVRIGFPFTMAAVIGGYLYCWFVLNI